MKILRKVAQQGEVAVYEIDAVPSDIWTTEVSKNSAGEFIVSHSESGHNHVIPGDSMVMERTDNVPAGMRMIYAILDKPGDLKQTAGHNHKSIDLNAGSYLFKISREYDPFAEQARIVAD